MTWLLHQAAGWAGLLLVIGVPALVLSYLVWPPRGRKGKRQ